MLSSIASSDCAALSNSSRSSTSLRPLSLVVGCDPSRLDSSSGLNKSEVRSPGRYEDILLEEREKTVDSRSSCLTASLRSTAFDARSRSRIVDL